jgi:hypothetical protein
MTRAVSADVLNNRSGLPIRVAEKRIPNMNNYNQVVRPRHFSESELKRVQVEIADAWNVQSNQRRRDQPNPNPLPSGGGTTEPGD